MQHLQLFEFVGRMLGKACYDGIVVDVCRMLIILIALHFIGCLW
jgi:hypothetical protein